MTRKILALMIVVCGFGVVGPSAAHHELYDYIIRVHYEGPGGKLTLTDGKNRFIAEYPVAIAGYLPKYLPAKAHIRRIMYRPTWHPTKNICRKTGQCRPVPPGPDNPLGVGFMALTFIGRGDNMIGIHGTNNPDRIGTRDTFGCIAMYNADWLELARRVRGRSVLVVLSYFK